MRKLTRREYLLYVRYKELGKEAAEAKKRQCEVKEMLLKVFGRAKTLRTPEGNHLVVETRNVVPTKVPAPYSFPVFSLKSTVKGVS